MTFMSVSRSVREWGKSALHDIFVTGQKFGVDILPRHFYSGIPDIRTLRASESWRQASAMTGVRGADLMSQMSFVQSCCSSFAERLRRGNEIHEQACRENGAGGYGFIEAQFLYCFIASKQPARIVQIGAGVSTAVILMAARDIGYTPRIICIDPYPTGYLTRLGKEGAIELVAQKAEEVDLGALTGVGAGDLLFVDSTHAVRPGSEVNRIVLEALPRLAPGVFVHFHDIYFPYDYQSTVLTTVTFAAESTLLHAFLINNRHFAIVASLSMLHHGCPQQLAAVFPTYRPANMSYGTHVDHKGHFPSSTWLTSD